MSLAHRRVSCLQIERGSKIPFPRFSSIPLAISLSLFLWIAGVSALAQKRFPPLLPSYPGGGGIITVLSIDDFNHDGYPDALVLNAAPPSPTASLSLMAGDGHGGFLAPVLLLSNMAPQAIAGDFNGDGIPDFAVINSNNAAQVFLNNGNGTFTAGTPTAFLPIASPVIGAVGDFNGDGHLDLVVADQGNSRVFVLPGDGHGNFNKAIISATPVFDAPGPMVAAELTGHGRVDLAISDSGADLMNGTTYVQLMLGDGRGHLGIGPKIATNAATITSMTAADLEGDGRLELVLATAGPSGYGSCFVGPGVAVLTPQPNATWPEIDYPVGTMSWAVAVADMNGDGRPDIVSANASGSFSVLFNQGPAAQSLFAPAQTYGILFSGGQLFLKDMTGKGSPDVVVSNVDGLQVLPNLGDGHFLLGNLIDVGLIVGRVAVADLNRDGIPDFAYLGQPLCGGNASTGFLATQFVSVVSANGLPFQTRYPSNTPSDYVAFSLGDLNGHGSLDALLAGFEDVKALFNDGKGNFSTSVIPSITTPRFNFVLADLNGDGFADLAYVGSEALYIAFGEGNGQFASPVAYPLDFGRLGFGGIVAEDVNQDGHMDLVFANQSGAVIEVFLGNGHGTFTEEQIYVADTSIGPVVFGDFNRDGKIDMAVGTSSGVMILFGNGDGTFSAPGNIPIPGGAGSVAVADLRGIGIEDLVVSPTSTATLFGSSTSVLNGDGKGSFGAPVTYYGVGGIAAAVDVNGDGAIDLVESVPFTGAGPVVIYNQGGTRISVSGTASKGQTATLTAQISASVEGAGTPTGRVKFFSGSKWLGTGFLTSGKARISTSALGTGTHWVHVLYQGNKSFNPHLSSSVPVVTGP